MARENAGLPTGSNITFKEDPKTGEVSMYVCGELFTKKNIRWRKDKSVLNAFKDEIKQHKDFVCPVEFDKMMEG